MSPLDSTKSVTNQVPAPQSNRETVESIVVAVILAFLFRTFVAEAFVIPTGSMAPTLLGNHKDVVCSKCGFAYEGGASCENEDRVGGDWGTVAATTCPLCRYTMTLDWTENPNQATFTGDRILVNKFAYDLGEPQRWDVIVFKYPGNAKINYIKRLVGLPHETLRLKNGDVFVQPEGESEYRIARKPPHKQLAMMQIVDDTRYTSQVAEWNEIGWPSRWQYSPPVETVRSSQEDRQGVALDGRQQQAWVRYRHLVFDANAWERLEAGQKPLPDQRVELIADFCAYNAVSKEQKMPADFRIDSQRRYEPESEQEGLHWVGDLALEADLTVSGQEGQVLLDLVEGGVHFSCTIDVATGRAALSISDVELKFEQGEPTAQTSLQGPGKYSVRYSNFDDEIRLWINQTLIEFSQPTTYGGSPDYSPLPAWSASDSGDWEPVGIGAHGLELRAEHLRVWRDIYYLAGSSEYRRPRSAKQIRTVFRNPESGPNNELFLDRNQQDYPLAADQFFPMGDNSPHSADARLWDYPKYVERELLIGKAAAVYWPHSWNRPIPFLPNVPKMRLIH